MKKIIASIILIFSMIICLASCGSSAEIDAARNKLDSLSSAEREEYTITVTVESEEDTITESYFVKNRDGKMSVEYKIEKLNAFVPNGDGFTIPEEYMTVSKGTFTDAELAERDFSVPSFDFKSNALQDCALGSGGQFSAKITSVNAFAGKDLTQNPAELVVIYDDDMIHMVKISYESDSGNVVTVTYQF